MIERSPTHYYDRSGRPITIEQFARLWSQWDYKHVARTKILCNEKPCFFVITIWLGMDVALGSVEGEVRGLYETAVFENVGTAGPKAMQLEKDGPSIWSPSNTFEEEEYATEEAAWDGHVKLHARAAATLAIRGGVIRLESETYKQAPDGESRPDDYNA